MTHGEAGLVLVFSLSAFLCLFAAANALDPAYSSSSSSPISYRHELRHVVGGLERACQVCESAVLSLPFRAPSRGAGSATAARGLSPRVLLP